MSVSSAVSSVRGASAAVLFEKFGVSSLFSASSSSKSSTSASLPQLLLYRRRFLLRSLLRLLRLRQLLLQCRGLPL